MLLRFAAFLTALLVTLAAGRALIPWLRRLRAGQSIREDGPTWHMQKQGTPTLGGIMFILGIAATVLTAGWPALARGDMAGLFVLLFSLVFGAIGCADDLVKIRKRHNEGLTAPQKFLLQLDSAVAFISLLRYSG